MSFVVALDGPAGSGKGTVTKILGEKYNLIYIDTGAMYRCVALACIEKNISTNELDKIKYILDNIEIQLKNIDGKQRVFLNNEDVTEKIRSTEVDNSVAKFSALKIVRDKITPLQRKMGENNNVIMEGRDIGTVVFPDADVKIFMDCSLEVRAKRRFRQNIEKGIECTYEEVLKSIEERHLLETQREVAPFIQAEDAIYMDSSDMSIEECVDAISKIIEEKM